jgi:hypothetical protein
MEEELVKALEKDALPDYKNIDLNTLSVKELKQALQTHNIPYSDCVEKIELINRMKENMHKF